MSDSKQIKILHVLHSFNMGGLENGVINLINNCNNSTFVHEVCCVTRSGNAEARLRRPVNIYELHKREGNDWSLIPKLVKLMKERHPDIVHTRNWGTIDGIVAARIWGVLTVIHGEHGWNMDDPLGRNLRRRIARKLLSGTVDHFVAVSNDIRNWMMKSVGINGSKITTIINGVNTDKFHPGDKNNARTKLGFPNSETVIGTVGRIDPIKDQSLLLRAFAKLNHRQNDLRLLVVGDGPERQHLESLRDSLPCRDRIIFLGGRDDVDCILRTLDVFVLPSRNEGMSNTILEAMATGLPVIATAVGGNPELVQDGHTGLLIPPADCDALTGALNFYIDEKPDMIAVHGHNARKRAVQDFSLTRMVSEYETLYIELARKAGIIV